MHPILFEIGGTEIHTYGALGAVAFLFTAAVTLYRLEQLGVDKARTTDLLFYGSLISLVGARVVFILQNPELFDGPASWINFRAGGLVFYGAMIIGLPASSYLMYRYKMPFFATWDVFATAMPIAHGISRFGCFAAGCCHGSVWDGPLAVVFPTGSAAPAGIPMHPTQLYEAFYLLFVGAVVNVFYYRKAFDGQVMLLYLMLYAFGRSVIEIFRGDITRGFFLEGVLGQTLTYSQGVSLVLALVALAVFFVGARRAQGNGPAEA